jgi:predicted TIM-barrel fold metal-dependent hydrolase
MLGWLEQMRIDPSQPDQRLLDLLALDFTSSDRILFASDHPWVDASEIPKSLRWLGLPAETEARILGGKARRLFKL